MGDIDIMAALHKNNFDRNSNCHEWETVSLSEISTIESLIKNRREFDSFYEVKLYETSNPYISNGVPVFSELIQCIYMDLDRLIKNANLTDKQKFIIDNLMKGYTESDIAKANNTDVKNIKNILLTACKKIKEQNDFEWQEWAEINGYAKIPSNVTYKQCSKCGKWLRANEDNFSPNSYSSDGYYSVCRMCKQQIDRRRKKKLGEKRP